MKFRACLHDAFERPSTRLSDRRCFGLLLSIRYKIIKLMCTIKGINQRASFGMDLLRFGIGMSAQLALQQGQAKFQGSTEATSACWLLTASHGSLLCFETLV